jgi:precorrin-2 dehydrogenase/sirohydrochlorin ferrochelatase
VRYYPVFVKVDGRRAVVVGGGKVAERKAVTLIRAGARVDLISPTITENLQRYRDRGLLRHIKRRFRKGDLKDAFVVIAATSSRDINTRVEREAQERGCLINVVDTPSEGNFIAPSIVRRGSLLIAISTEGHSPGLSKAIRKELESLYDGEFSRYLRFAGRIRRQILKETKDRKTRERLLRFLSSDEVFRALRDKGFTEATRMVLDYISS